MDVVAMRKLKKAVWIATFNELRTRAEIDRLVERYADAGFDLLLPCVKGIDGVVAYPGADAPVRANLPSWDPLEAFVSSAHAVGLKVHPWFCVIPVGPKLVRRHPDWIARNSKGRRAHCFSCYYTCAANRDATNYHHALMADVVRRYDVDGIHLDYIRTGEDTCYCPLCLAAYKRVTGLKAPLPGKAYDLTPAWRQWRINNITRLVARVSRTCKRAGKEVSAAVFVDYPMPRFTQSQDYVQWSEKGLVDVVMPMAYDNDHIMTVAFARNHMANWRGKAKLWEGLCPAVMPRPADLAEQMRRVKDAGIKGVALFAHKHITDGHLKAIKGI